MMYTNMIKKKSWFKISFWHIIYDSVWCRLQKTNM